MQREQREENLLSVRYADLVQHPLATLCKIADRFGLDRPDSVQMSPLVGLEPNLGPHVGRWREWMTAEELELFHRDVPRDCPYLDQG